MTDPVRPTVVAPRGPSCCTGFRRRSCAGCGVRLLVGRTRCCADTATRSRTGTPLLTVAPILPQPPCPARPVRHFACGWAVEALSAAIPYVAPERPVIHGTADSGIRRHEVAVPRSVRPGRIRRICDV